MDTKNKKEISRRDFFKIAGAAAGAVGMTACGRDGTALHNGEGPEGEMTCRTLTGDRVSLLGYGCMRWPVTSTPEGDTVSQDDVNRLVDYALAHGVNYFDTSPAYTEGRSETLTGNALSRHPRQNYFIATKMSNFAATDFRSGVQMYRDSMKALRTDYFDYYLHRFLDNGLLDFLLKEREAGRIRHLGWSFHGIREEFDRILACHEKYHWDFVQIQLNYSDWHYPTTSFGQPNVEASYLYGELRKRGIPVTVMEPLLGGRLSRLPGRIVERLKQRAPESSVASWAFRFAGSQEGVLTVLSGMTYMEHLQDNLKTFSPLRPLTPQEVDFLDETARLMQSYPTVPCNDCKYCMPCPFGLDIPAILLHYNKCVNEEKIIHDPSDDNYRRARREFLIGYDRSVPRLRQADHCVGCRKCVEHCPQRIDIPSELHRIDRYVEQLKQDRE